MNSTERGQAAWKAWNQTSLAVRATQYGNNYQMFYNEYVRASHSGGDALAQLRQMEAARPPLPEPRISHAERARGLAELRAIAGGTTLPHDHQFFTSTMPGAAALDDAALMAEWNRSPALQHEFPTAGCYAAYAKAEASGLVKVHSGRGLQRLNAGAR